LRHIHLLGFGRFGRQYYKEICKLRDKGLVQLGFVASRTGFHSYEFNQFVVPWSEDLLTTVKPKDLVVIATPSRTHPFFVSLFSERCYVLCEKPFAFDDSSFQLLQSCNLSKFIPSLIFRRRDISNYLKDYISTLDNPFVVDSEFINPQFNDLSLDVSPALEMLHLVDILCWSTNLSLNTTALKFSVDMLDTICLQNDQFSATFKCGWSPNTKSRFLKVISGNSIVKADYVLDIAEITDSRGSYSFKRFFDQDQAINKQLIFSLGLIESDHSLSFSLHDSERRSSLKTADLLIRAESIYFASRTRSKRIAVVGAGIFGCQIALTLSKDYNVFLFEKNTAICQESTFLNQWRHHSGFHYPLSFSTINEILNTKNDFETIYGSAINRDVRSYYHVASNAQEIPKSRYLNTCNYFNLDYDVINPPREVISGSVSVSLLTDEAVYDIPMLISLLSDSLSSSSVDLNLNTVVSGCKINESGFKVLQINNESNSISMDFDYVIDCTNSSGLLKLPGFLPDNQIRFELVELLELEIPWPMVSHTIIDGPFVSLTSMGVPNRFLLSHRDFSVHRRIFSSTLPDPSMFTTNQSNADLLLESINKYLSLPSGTRVVKSWISRKSISPYTNEVWERPTVIRDHGFGIFSIIGGKILTSVSNSYEIKDIIDRLES